MLSLLALSILSSQPLRAVDPAELEYVIPRVEVEPVIDGRLDEAAWNEALVLELGIETDPGENVPAPVRTSCRLMHSRTHLFYGCVAYDPEPERIRARRQHGRSERGRDLVGTRGRPELIRRAAGPPDPR
ncbi:MAG TPA: hypothetical protein VMT85_13900 [Thermoanaerobaculia bacterium]|nr:hypothetical protein [Thermoanaerobaculia bacterium]